MKYELEFQEIIQQKGILKLVHVTRKDNLRSILDHGILPRKTLDKDKIKYLVIDDIPVNVRSIKKNWHQNHVRDQFQRNALSRGYQENSPEDWIMISDIDEIPDPKRIKEFDVRKKYACFMQKNFQSNI